MAAFAPVHHEHGVAGAITRILGRRPLPVAEAANVESSLARYEYAAEWASMGAGNSAASSSGTTKETSWHKLSALEAACDGRCNVKALIAEYLQGADGESNASLSAVSNSRAGGQSDGVPARSSASAAAGSWRVDKILATKLADRVVMPASAATGGAPSAPTSVVTRERMYLVRWWGRPVSDCSWEYASDLTAEEAHAAIDAFHASWAAPADAPADPLRQLMGTYTPGLPLTSCPPVPVQAALPLTAAPVLVAVDASSESFSGAAGGAEGKHLLAAQMGQGRKRGGNSSSSSGVGAASTSAILQSIGSGGGSAANGVMAMAAGYDEDDGALAAAARDTDVAGGGSSSVGGGPGNGRGGPRDLPAFAPPPMDDLKHSDEFDPLTKWALQAVRSAAGVKQKEIAEAAGVSQPQISSWISNVSVRMGIASLAKIRTWLFTAGPKLAASAPSSVTADRIYDALDRLRQAPLVFSRGYEGMSAAEAAQLYEDASGDVAIVAGEGDAGIAAALEKSRQMSATARGASKTSNGSTGDAGAGAGASSSTDSAAAAAAAEDDTAGASSSSAPAPASEEVPRHNRARPKRSVSVGVTWADGDASNAATQLPQQQGPPPTQAQYLDQVIASGGGLLPDSSPTHALEAAVNALPSPVGRPSGGAGGSSGKAKATAPAGPPRLRVLPPLSIPAVTLVPPCFGPSSSSSSSSSSGDSGSTDALEAAGGRQTVAKAAAPLLAAAADAANLPLHVIFPPSATPVLVPPRKSASASADVSSKLLAQSVPGAQQLLAQLTSPSQQQEIAVSVASSSHDVSAPALQLAAALAASPALQPALLIARDAEAARRWYDAIRSGNEGSSDVSAALQPCLYVAGEASADVSSASASAASQLDFIRQYEWFHVGYATGLPAPLSSSSGAGGLDTSALPDVDGGESATTDAAPTAASPAALQASKLMKSRLVITTASIANSQPAVVSGLRDVAWGAVVMVDASSSTAIPALPQAPTGRVVRVISGHPATAPVPLTALVSKHAVPLTSRQQALLKALASLHADVIATPSRYPIGARIALVDALKAINDPGSIENLIAAASSRAANSSAASASGASHFGSALRRILAAQESGEAVSLAAVEAALTPSPQDAAAAASSAQDAASSAGISVEQVLASATILVNGRDYGLPYMGKIRLRKVAMSKQQQQQDDGVGGEGEATAAFAAAAGSGEQEQSEQSQQMQQQAGDSEGVPAQADVAMTSAEEAGAGPAAESADAAAGPAASDQVNDDAGSVADSVTKATSAAASSKPGKHRGRVPGSKLYGGVMLPPPQQLYEIVFPSEEVEAVVSKMRADSEALKTGPGRRSSGAGLAAVDAAVRSSPSPTSAAAAEGDGTEPSAAESAAGDSAIAPSVETAVGSSEQTVAIAAGDAMVVEEGEASAAAVPIAEAAAVTAVDKAVSPSTASSMLASNPKLSALQQLLLSTEGEASFGPRALIILSDASLLPLLTVRFSQASGLKVESYAPSPSAPVLDSATSALVITASDLTYATAKGGHALTSLIGSTGRVILFDAAVATATTVLPQLQRLSLPPSTKVIALVGEGTIEERLLDAAINGVDSDLKQLCGLLQGEQHPSASAADSASAASSLADLLLSHSRHLTMPPQPPSSLPQPDLSKEGYLPEKVTLPQSLLEKTAVDGAEGDVPAAAAESSSSSSSSSSSAVTTVTRWRAQWSTSQWRVSVQPDVSALTSQHAQRVAAWNSAKAKREVVFSAVTSAVLLVLAEAQSLGSLPLPSACAAPSGQGDAVPGSAVMQQLLTSGAATRLVARLTDSSDPSAAPAGGAAAGASNPSSTLASHLRRAMWAAAKGHDSISGGAKGGGLPMFLPSSAAASSAHQHATRHSSPVKPAGARSAAAAGGGSEPSPSAPLFEAFHWSRHHMSQAYGASIGIYIDERRAVQLRKRCGRPPQDLEKKVQQAADDQSTLLAQATDFQKEVQAGNVVFRPADGWLRARFALLATVRELADFISTHAPRCGSAVKPLPISPELEDEAAAFLPGTSAADVAGAEAEAEQAPADAQSSDAAAPEDEQPSAAAAEDVVVSGSEPASAAGVVAATEGDIEMSEGPSSSAAAAADADADAAGSPAATDDESADKVPQSSQQLSAGSAGAGAGSSPGPVAFQKRRGRPSKQAMAAALAAESAAVAGVVDASSSSSSSNSDLHRYLSACTLASVTSSPDELLRFLSSYVTALLEGHPLQRVGRLLGVALTHGAKRYFNKTQRSLLQDWEATCTSLQRHMLDDVVGLLAASLVGQPSPADALASVAAAAAPVARGGGKAVGERGTDYLSVVAVLKHMQKTHTKAQQSAALADTVHHHHHHSHGSAASTGCRFPIGGVSDASVCCLCEQGGLLLSCEGPCSKSYHLSCLGLPLDTASLPLDPADGKWRCPCCASGTHMCELCARPGRLPDLRIATDPDTGVPVASELLRQPLMTSGGGGGGTGLGLGGVVSTATSGLKWGDDIVTKCAVKGCGRFYHPDCALGHGRTKAIGAVQLPIPGLPALERYVCPSHSCAACGSEGAAVSKSAHSEASGTLLPCLRCANVLHKRCVTSDGGVQVTPSSVLCSDHFLSPPITDGPSSADATVAALMANPQPNGGPVMSALLGGTKAAAAAASGDRTAGLTSALLRPERWPLPPSLTGHTPAFKPGPGILPLPTSAEGDGEDAPNNDAQARVFAARSLAGTQYYSATAARKALLDQARTVIALSSVPGTPSSGSSSDAAALVGDLAYFSSAVGPNAGLRELVAVYHEWESLSGIPEGSDVSGAAAVGGSGATGSADAAAAGLTSTALASMTPAQRAIALALVAQQSGHQAQQQAQLWGGMRVAPNQPMPMMMVPAPSPPGTGVSSGQMMMMPMPPMQMQMAMAMQMQAAAAAAAVGGGSFPPGIAPPMMAMMQQQQQLQQDAPHQQESKQQHKQQQAQQQAAAAGVAEAAAAPPPPPPSLAPVYLGSPDATDALMIAAPLTVSLQSALEAVLGTVREAEAAEMNREASRNEAVGLPPPEHVPMTYTRAVLERLWRQRSAGSVQAIADAGATVVDPAGLECALCHGKGEAILPGGGPAASPVASDDGGDDGESGSASSSDAGGGVQGGKADGRVTGPFLPHPFLLAGRGAKGSWVHSMCALLCPEVVADEEGQLYFLNGAMRRARQLRCKACKQTGASIGCYVPSCSVTYHVPCAAAVAGADFARCREAFCLKHKGTPAAVTIRSQLAAQVAQSTFVFGPVEEASPAAAAGAYGGGSGGYQQEEETGAGAGAGGTERKRKRRRSEPAAAAASAAAMAAPSYCFCGVSDDVTDGSYIGCDACGAWYHHSCVGMRDDEAEGVASWKCPRCTGRPVQPLKGAPALTSGADWRGLAAGGGGGVPEEAEGEGDGGDVSMGGTVPTTGGKKRGRKSHADKAAERAAAAAAAALATPDTDAEEEAAAEPAPAPAPAPVSSSPPPKLRLKISKPQPPAPAAAEPAAEAPADAAAPEAPAAAAAPVRRKSLALSSSSASAAAAVAAAAAVEVEAEAAPALLLDPALRGPPGPGPRGPKKAWAPSGDDELLISVLEASADAAATPKAWSTDVRGVHTVRLRLRYEPRCAKEMPPGYFGWEVEDIRGFPHVYPLPDAPAAAVVGGEALAEPASVDADSSAAGKPAARKRKSTTATAAAAAEPSDVTDAATVGGGGDEGAAGLAAEGADAAAAAAAAKASRKPRKSKAAAGGEDTAASEVNGNEAADSGIAPEEAAAAASNAQSASASSASSSGGNRKRVKAAASAPKQTTEMAASAGEEGLGAPDAASEEVPSAAGAASARKKRGGAGSSSSSSAAPSPSQPAAESARASPALSAAGSEQASSLAAAAAASAEGATGGARSSRKRRRPEQEEEAAEEQAGSEAAAIGGSQA